MLAARKTNCNAVRGLGFAARKTDCNLVGCVGKSLGFVARKTDCSAALTFRIRARGEEATTCSGSCRTKKTYSRRCKTKNTLSGSRDAMCHIFQISRNWSKVEERQPPAL